MRPIDPSARRAPRWSTSSHGERADATPAELSVLVAQRDACRAACGRLFLLRCAFDRAGGFAASHVVTTLTSVAVLIGLPLLLS